jgi:hypothetical protein
MKKKKDEWIEMTDAIGKYFKKQGWSIIVISSPQIRHNPNDMKYNHELVFKITAKNQTPE